MLKYVHVDKYYMLPVLYLNWSNSVNKIPPEFPQTIYILICFNHLIHLFFIKVEFFSSAYGQGGYPDF